MKLEKSCKKAVPSVLGLIHQTLGNRRLFASFFHLKWMQRTSENTLLFSFSHQALPRKSTSVSAREPSWCWIPVLLVPRQRVPHSPPLPTSERTFMAQCPSPFPCLPLLARSSCFQGCYYAHSEIFIFYFFFDLCILITCPPFQKAGCSEIMKCFHRSCCFLFLWIPLLTESYWFPEGNCLDFFIASICSHRSHWQTFCLLFRHT